MSKTFCRTQPCADCPYRKDAPLKKWDAEDFERLLETDSDEMGSVYQCHKKDDHICVGWLINQRDRNLPSINLRIALIRHKVSHTYLESLHCTVKMFSSVLEMCKANYPKIFKHFI